MDRSDRKKTDNKYVIIDGIRYRLDSLYSDDRERIESFRRALKRELRILNGLEVLYLSENQRESYISFGLVECSFCQEEYRDKVHNCPKCGYGPGPHKVRGVPDPARTNEMIAEVIGPWKQKGD